MKRILPILTLFSVLLLNSCGAPPPGEKPPLHLKEAKFSDLPNWGGDNLKSFSLAFSRSCENIKQKNPGDIYASFKESGSVTFARMQKLCADYQALTLSSSPAKTLYIFFERRLQPWAVLAGHSPKGLFTGYYEASLRGSRTKTKTYRYPLYARPSDLVMVDLGEFREKLKGERIAGRVIDGRLKPYEDRARITAGDWPHKDKVMLWVDDSVDAFFVQIQGSGVVKMADGGTVRIGYDGQNGYPYYAIGRELVKNGALKKEEVSMDSIRNWLAMHPDKADELMNLNPSYVFFKELGGEGPIGGEGVALTPGRSLAVDRTEIPYGSLLWTDIDEPQKGTGALQRMMIAQDTGGAISGPVRGDVFWGFGPQAEAMAGAMKSQGRYWILLPKSL